MHEFSHSGELILPVFPHDSDVSSQVVSQPNLRVRNAHMSRTVDSSERPVGSTSSPGRV